MAASSPPRRRFVPEPVETSTRSSRRPHSDLPGPHSPQVRFETVNIEPSSPSPSPSDPMPAATKPRKFLPQPVEESARSSKRFPIEPIESTSTSRRRRKDPQAEDSNNSSPKSEAPHSPVAAANSGDLTNKPSPRRFAPEPVETTTKSSRRKFAPEPVESSTRTSRDRHKDDTVDSINEFANPPTWRRFLPDAGDTTPPRRRRKPDGTEEEDSDKSPSSQTNYSLSTPPSRSSSGRRFEPELLETAKGSFKRHVYSPSSTPEHLKSPRSNTREEEVSEQESRFSAASLARRLHEEKRQHSFRVPDLPAIESDESDESEPPSLSGSPSDSSVDTERLRLSGLRPQDPSYASYVLRLNENKKLQEQAMAAYINERPHEPVAHYAIDDEGEDGLITIGKFSGADGTDRRTFRRESAADLTWELQNMRRHHEQLEEAKRDYKENTAGQSRFSAAALATRHHLGIGVKRGLGGHEHDPELVKMREAANPPMLGSDIVFPFSVSPKMTRCDVDQLPRPRTAEKDENEIEVEGDPQLWSAQFNVSNRSSAGLWMGLCQKGKTESRPATPMRSGIQTPAYEPRNAFDPGTPGRGTATPGKRHGRPHSGLNFLALGHPRDPHGSEDLFTASIDQKLNLEKQIEEEFPDRVITQIYNYLSLGYPSLAYPYDDELSKITRIPVEELRRDDELQDAKGYVGAPEGDGVDEDGVTGGKCKRWEALRLYVKEWARQSPVFQEKKGVTGDWGARERRGSWAL